MGAETLPDLDSIPVRHETLEELGMQSVPTGVSKMGLKKKHLLIQELLRNEEVRQLSVCLFLTLFSLYRPLSHFVCVSDYLSLSVSVSISRSLVVSLSLVSLSPSVSHSLSV